MAMTDTRLFKCRACGALNDFDAIEENCTAEYMAELEAEGKDSSGAFAVLGSYQCCACGFTIEPAPMWFVTPMGDQPVWIESGFETVHVP
jgi:hypothetical protein